VASGEIEILSGGASSLVASPPSVRPGEEIRFTLVLSNTESAALPFSYRLPLPSGTEYSSHSGGNYGGGALTWTGTIQGQSSHTAVLVVRARSQLEYGAIITATAEIDASGGALERLVRVVIGRRLALPLVLQP
jgi:hypothetical protein